MEQNTEELVKSARRKLRFLLIGVVATVSIFLLFLKFNSSPDQGIEKSNGVEIVTPISTGNPYDIYNLGGHQFSIPNQWSVSSSQGPDFMVYRVMTIDSVMFGIYLGWHPSLPDGLEGSILEKSEPHTLHDSLVLDDRNRKIDAALLNGVFTERIKAHDSYDYETEQVIPSEFDSLTMSLFTKSGRNIWTLEPPLMKEGDIDILIEFGQDVESKIHIFGENIKPSLRTKIVEIAKSMK